MLNKSNETSQSTTSVSSASGTSVTTQASERSQTPKTLLLAKMTNIIRTTSQCDISKDKQVDILDFVITDHTLDEMTAIYNTWATNYDDDMANRNYKAPQYLAEYINNTLQVATRASILDVGCGTGLLAIELRKLCYDDIEGIDMSSAMIDIARSKNAYSRYHNIKVEKTPANSLHTFPDKSFTCVCLCGSFLPGHVTPDVLPALGRLVKSDGYLIWISEPLDTYIAKTDKFSSNNVMNAVDILKNKCKFEEPQRKIVSTYRRGVEGEIYAFHRKAD